MIIRLYCIHSICIQTDLNNTILQVAEAGLNGVALWDSSTSFQSAEDCVALRDFLDTTLGPFVRYVTTTIRTCSEQVCNSHGRCTKTNWRNKVAKVHVNVPRKRSILTYIFEQFMLTILEICFPRQIGKRTYSARDNNEHYATERFPRFSCTCYKNWVGKFCKTKKKAL